MLNVYEQIPDGFLEAEPENLLAVLSGPSLIHLPGRRKPSLFVSVMLHGNEPTGLRVVQSLLRDYVDKELPRALSIFVGNVTAAAQGMRRLDGQPDYNRVWGDGDSPEHEMMMQVREEMRRRGVIASVDIHNNTGLNPHYACVNKLDNEFLQLASMFGRTVVYFTKPEGVQSLSFSDFCPAVTLECGQPGQAYGVEHAKDYVDACLNLAEVPTHPVAAHDINVFHTVAIVTVPSDVSFGFDEEDVQLQFFEDIDHFNFSELPAGTSFGWRHSLDAYLACQDEKGDDVGQRYFSYEDNKIQLAVPVMPSMLTLDKKVIRQDCFCYLMERMDIEDVKGGIGNRV
ncbi:M14 family metallopeptidase [Pseudomonadota bacterium]